jgi:glyoxylase-like metal-dependent hydrolase (beta-lactamase superfamily II)
MNIFPKISGAEVVWDVLVFGHLFWNPYFGESPDNPPRGIPSTCSSVLVRGTDADGRPYRLIIDPTIRHSAEEYYFDLNRRTGLRPEAITHCFSTHHHFDHWNGLKYFPNASWFAGPGNKTLIAAAVKEAEGRDPGDGLSPLIPWERITEVAGEFLPGIYALPLPGHTAELHGIAFKSEGKRVLVAADAVMTKDHFYDHVTAFQKDASLKAAAARTISDISESFDIVVPGHDNQIVLLTRAID